MRIVTAVGAMLIAATATAQEPEHCYYGDAPTDALVPTEVQHDTAMHLLGGYFYIPIILRRVCGLTDQSDRDYLDFVRIGMGCSEQTPLGRAHIKLLVAQPEELEGFACWNDLEVTFPDYTAQYCEIAARIPPPSSLLEGAAGSDQANSEYSTAMRQLQDLYESHPNADGVSRLVQGCEAEG